jgi:hypothetical protein
MWGIETIPASKQGVRGENKGCFLSDVYVVCLKVQNIGHHYYLSNYDTVFFQNADSYGLIMDDNKMSNAISEMGVQRVHNSAFSHIVFRLIGSPDLILYYSILHYLYNI